MRASRITSALVIGMSLGFAPCAHADDINREVCLVVMAMGVNPYDPSDHYALNMLERQTRGTKRIGAMSRGSQDEQFALADPSDLATRSSNSAPECQGESC